MRRAVACKLLQHPEPLLLRRHSFRWGCSLLATFSVNAVLHQPRALSQECQSLPSSREISFGNRFPYRECSRISGAHGQVTQDPAPCL